MDERITTAAIHDLDTARGALEYLRGNRLDRALELLETGLEVSVVTLTALLHQADPSQRERILQALRSARDYRTTHPRRTEVDTTEWDEKLERGARGLRERAQKILDELK